MAHDPQRSLDLGQQPVDPRAVDALHLLEHPDVDAVFLSDADERAQVFRQASPTEAETRVQEVGADAGVHTDALRYGPYVDAERFAQVGHHIDERDLRGEERVRRLLDEFRRRHTRDHDRTIEAGLV